MKRIRFCNVIAILSGYIGIITGILTSDIRLGIFSVITFVFSWGAIHYSVYSKK